MADESSTTAGIPEDFKTVGGHYNLTRKLGEGAFGVVFEAHHELLDQEFAVKILKPEMCADPSTRDRFLDEARALIRFSHTNVVQLRHVGEQSGQLYLVMDLVRGQPVDELIKAGEAFDEERAVGAIMQVLAGLEAAHAAGIVHRDLKPSNLILEHKPDGTDYVRILDFGLSKLSAIDGQQSMHRSVTGSIIGTLAYMSPEQLSGEEKIDGRADLFATGLVLQELLQGHHPYPGESGIVVAAKLLRDPVPPLPPRVLDTLSASTQTALATALERDRDARYLSATAFRQALLGKGPPSDTSTITTIAHARQDLARREAAEARSVALTKAEKKSNKGLLVGIGIVVIAGAIGAFVMLNNKKSDPEPVNVSEQPDKPVDPEPTQPDKPVDPEPAQPDKPVDPEPAQPDKPVDPEPAQPDNPVDPEPAQPDKPVDPEPAQPDKPVDPEPADPGMPGKPQECCAAAAKLRAKGKWAEARTYYFHTLEKLDADWLPAIRGASEAYITEADRMARSGNVAGALKLYDEAIAWAGREYDRYAAGKSAHATKQLQLGYARLYRGQAYLERSRWLRAPGGDVAKAAVELKAAKTDFQFAGQLLLKEGLDDAEYRIRRAELSRLEGDTMRMVNDLKWVTQEANESVIYAYMWVAHARSMRRLGEAGLWSQGDRRQEAAFAENAWQVARKGASYREKELSKGEWLELCRVAWVRAMYESDPVKLQSMASMLRWWLQLARAKPALGFESQDLSTAREDTADAMLAYVNGLALYRGGKQKLAAEAFAKATTLAQTAITKRERVATAGERLGSSLPFRVLGFTELLLDKKDAATATFAKGKAADATNPD